MIYFQGTDNTIWHINPDGTGGARLAGYKSLSQPVVYGNTVYFQGIDYKLCTCNLNGTNLVNFGGFQTSSAPFVTATGVYFQQHLSNALMKVKLDGSGAVILGGNTTQSTPFVRGQFVFFRGTDDKLWRILIDGTGGINLGLYQTSSSPFATMQYVFFRGNDDKLWRTNLDGTQGIVLGGGYKTSSTPFVTDQHVYFQGTDNKLWQINIDGSGGTNLGGYKCNSSPTVDTSQNFVYFQGTDNALWRLNMNGSNGTHLGGFNTNSTPFVVQPGNQPQSAGFQIPYAVLLLAYAPPGSNNGKNDCQVEYSSGSTAGTTVSISSSFKYNLGITADLSSDNSKGNGAGFGLSYGSTTSDQSSLDIKKDVTFDLKVPGPASDGIDHGRDVIYLLLKPKMNVVIDPQYNMNWGLDFNSDNGGVIYLQMNWLQDPALFAQTEPDLKRRCDAAGMVAKDYAQLLSLNPFAAGPAPIDPNRYLLTNIYIPYIPPQNADDPVPLLNQTMQGTVTYGSTHTEETTKELSLTGEAQVGLPSMLQLALKVTGTFDWTTSTASTTTNAATQTATINGGAPSAGYTGSTDLLVYLDTMFNVFMFAFPTDPPTFSGTFRDPSGKPLPNTRVKLTIGSQTFHTTTDAKGTYNFYYTPKGRGEVTLDRKLVSSGDILKNLGGDITKLQ